MYQNEFVARCIEAMNMYPDATPATKAPSTTEVADANERADVRCVAITFETRPDWCKKEHINRMLDLGVTKVELGVQHIDDTILAFNRRGCTVADTVEANRLLRDAGIKVGFHMMPNLPHSTIESDRAMFETIFSDPRFKPDFLKIYPTLVTPGSEIEELWELKRYTPYVEEQLIDLIAYAKTLIPEYTRLSQSTTGYPGKTDSSRVPALQFPPTGPEQACCTGKALPMYTVPGDREASFSFRIGNSCNPLRVLWRYGTFYICGVWRLSYWVCQASFSRE